MRIAGMVELDRLATQADRSGIRPEHARKQFHQRRFTGSVLAHDGMNLASVADELHVAQGLDRAKALAEAFDLDQGRGSHHRIQTKSQICAACRACHRPGKAGPTGR